MKREVMSGPEGSTPFSEWATDWLKRECSTLEVTPQARQALRQKVYGRLDALLGTNAEAWEAIFIFVKSDSEEGKGQLETVEEQIESYKKRIEKLKKTIQILIH